MAVVNVLAVAVALVALACLPCAVALFIISADEYTELMWRALRRGLRRCRRRIGAVAGFGWFAPYDPPRPPGPPIEQIAADLRRLGRQRVGIATRSTVWHTAVQRAYDEKLRAACQSLSVSHYMDGLDGLDLEIERVRVEGELVVAGMVLSTSDADRRQGMA